MCLGKPILFECPVQVSRDCCKRMRHSQLHLFFQGRALIIFPRYGWSTENLGTAWLGYRAPSSAKADLFPI